MTHSRAALTALSLLLAFGVLTLFVRERWALAAFQLGVLAITLLWLYANFFFNAPVRLHPALAPLAFFPIWGAAQLLTARSQAPWHTVESITAATVTLFACFLLLQTLDSPRTVRLLEDSLLAFALLIGVVAALQAFSSQGKAFWLFETGYPNLVLGPFVYHNKFAQFIELVFPLALWRAIESPRRAPLFITAAAILAAGVVAGASRSGAAFLLFEIVAVLVLARLRGAISSRAASLFALQTLAFVAVWGFLAGWQDLWNRLTVIDPLTDHRWPIMASTLEILRAYPLFGAGLGAWPSVYPQFASFDIGVFVNQAHCDWLQFAADGGLPLLLAALAFPVLILKPLLRSVWGVGFLTVCLHAAIDYPFHQLPAFSTLLFVTALLAATHHHPQTRSVSEGQHIPPRPEA